MAIDYNKTNWSPGQLVTATDMNKIEEGVYNLYDDTKRIVPHYASTGYVVKIPHNSITSLNNLTISNKYQTGNGLMITSSSGDEPLAEFLGTAGKDSNSIVSTRASMIAVYGNSSNRISAMIDQSGNCTYEITNPAAFRKAAEVPNYTVLTGDTYPTTWMPYHISSSNINSDNNGFSSSDNIVDGYAIVDGQGKIAGFFGVHLQNDGTVVTEIRAIHGNYNNFIKVAVKKDGSCTYSIKDVDAFKAALGIS